MTSRRELQQYDRARNLKPVSDHLMEIDDQLFLLRCESAATNVRPKVVDPSQTTTLTASLEACQYGKGQS